MFRSTNSLNPQEELANAQHTFLILCVSNLFLLFPPSTSPDEASSSNINPSHQLQKLKRDTHNKLPFRKENIKIKISCHCLAYGFWKSLMGGEWDVVSGQQCLLHIHAFCAVLQGDQWLSAFDFWTTFSSFSACTQPQRKTTSMLRILFPTRELLFHFSSGQIIRYKALHSKISWDTNVRTASLFLRTARQISACGDTDLFLSAKGYTLEPLLTVHTIQQRGGGWG